MASIFGSGTQKPTRLNAMKVTQSCLGLPYPTIMGTGRIQQSLLWMNGFSSVAAPSGGKGIGGGKGGSGFIYSSDVIVALCNGPILAVMDLWQDQSWIRNDTITETYTASAPGIYTPTQASAFVGDHGVAVPTAYDDVFDDLNAPTSTALSGTDGPPMQLVPFGSELNQGEYSISTESIGTFALSAAGNTYLDSGTQPVTDYTGTGFGADNSLLGYTFVVTGFTNASNNGSFTCVANTSTTLTLDNSAGIAETTSAVASEIGVTYHFSAADQALGTQVQITYKYNLPYITAQENDIIPSSKEITVGAPWYLGVDKGVIYYSSGDIFNPLNGTALTPVTTNPPTVTGTYYFVSSGSTVNGNQYYFAPGDVNQEVQITYEYQDLQPYQTKNGSTGIPESLSFTLFNGANGQAPSSFVTNTFPSEALAYSNTAYALFTPMNLGESAQVHNNSYEVQTSDIYGGGVVDCDPVQCILQVLTNPVWGLGSGFQPFPAVIIDNGPQGTWGGPSGTPVLIGGGVQPKTISTGPVTVAVHASSGAGWQGLGGSLLSTTVVNTPVFNQVIPNYPIYGFALTSSTTILGITVNGTYGGYKLNPMVAVETTSNSALLDTKTLLGTTSTFTMDMTGAFTVPADGTYTFYVNYANYSSWAFYVQSVTVLSGVTPPSGNTISQGDGNPPFPSTGPTTGYTKIAEQSKDDGSHPTPSTIRVSLTKGTHNWEAVYVQTSPISPSGEANGYFQITTQNGAGPIATGGSAAGTTGTLGVAILPTAIPGTRTSGTTAFNWFASNGFFISPVLDKQDAAASVIGDWLEAGMCAAFMSEGLMKLVPYGDTSTAGYGCTWLAPSAYVVALDDTCYVKKEGEDPVKISRSPWQDAHNNVQVKWDNRLNQYSPEITPDSDQTSINRYGLRLEDPVDFNFIHTPVAATFSASMRVKRSVNIRNTYTFTLPFYFSYLEPMDIVTLTASSVWNTSPGNVNLNLVNQPVRIQKIVDDPNEGLNIEAEDYPYGVGQPVLFNKGIAANNPVNNAYVLPGNTEVILFEPTGRQTVNYSGTQIWIGASGASNFWGGCQIWVSSDGLKYKQIGEIDSRARIGTLAYDFPTSVSDPDTNNELVITMATNCPPLDAGTADDADQGNTECFVDGEIISYSSCTITGQSQFTMNLGAPSVPGYMRRGQLGTSIAAHAANSLFMRIDATVFKYTYDPVWFGKTIFFKFLSFNLFKNEVQALADVPAIPFTISGVLGAVDASSGLVLATNTTIGAGPLGWAPAAYTM